MALLAAPAWASEWVRVRAPQLEVLSDVGPEPAREAAERLVRLRSALRQLFPAREHAERDLTLLMFGSRERFAGFVPRAHRRPDRVEGFFRGGGERDYAVLHFAAHRPHPFGAAEHEYAHLALNASLPAQPVWVAEGLAELLSDAALEGGVVRIGGGRPDHEAHLARAPLLPLRALLQIGHDSPEYLGAVDSDVLYAECWALARWVVHRAGLEGLRAFLIAVADGREPAAAFEEELGSLSSAEATLHLVPADPLLRVPATSAALLRVDVPSEADVEQRLGDLLLQGGYAGRARVRFERALAADPDHVPSRTGLAQLLLRQGQWGEARRQLDRALAVSPDDPVVILRRVRLRVQEALSRGEPLGTETRDRLVAELEDVASRAPRLHEAALLLARLRPEPYAERIALLQPLFDQQPDRVALAQTLSHLHVKNRDLPSARRVLERAREATGEPAYRFLFDHLLARLGDFEAATQEVRGRLVKLECPSDGSLRFTVEAGAATLQLEAASTRSFFIRGASDDTGERQLVCGALDLPLTVRYRRVGNDPRVVGQVLWLSLPEPSDEAPRP
jgi:tetratricopeptide (TPR) repeat protein